MNIFLNWFQRAKYNDSCEKVFTLHNKLIIPWVIFIVEYPAVKLWLVYVTFVHLQCKVSKNRGQKWERKRSIDERAQICDGLLRNRRWNVFWWTCEKKGGEFVNNKSFPWICLSICVFWLKAGVFMLIHVR